MSYFRDQTWLLKQVFKSLPYRVKVRHGKGTSASWIKIYIPKAFWLVERERTEIERQAAFALHREKEENNRIAVYWYE